MLQHQDVIAEIMFDFDGTLISGYSAVTFIQEQVRRGNLSVRELIELISAMASFGIGRMGFSAMMIAASQFLRRLATRSNRQRGISASSTSCSPSWRSKKATLRVRLSSRPVSEKAR
jgi:hypothetical protein